ncbi:MAG: glycosyltransferase family 39 protein [Ginsengibacter sp.]
MWKKIKSIRNPFILFLPFLLLYILFVLFMYSTENSGDQSRYMGFVDNLLKGYYSPPPPLIDLTNGPGYPLFLLPFAALHIPKLFVVLINAGLHYLSIIFVFKSLIQFASFRKTFILSLFWACYFNAYQNMAALTTETITIFLIALLMYSITKAFGKPDFKGAWKFIILAGFVFGYIVLTKVIFAYIVLVMLIGCIILWLFKRNSVNYRKAVIILVIAFTTFSPYLFYTYSLTGKVFYLSSASDALYWMSSPYNGEYGDWKGDLEQNPVDLGNYNIPGASDSLIAHHKKNFDEIYKLEGALKQSEMFESIAIENIKKRPLKYAQNVFYNLGRIFFHYPFSYAIQRPKSLFAMPLNGIILTFILLCIFPTIIYWKKLLFQLKFLLFIAFIYLGISSLLSAETRMLTMVVPILIFWFGYIIQKTIKLNVKNW